MSRVSEWSLWIVTVAMTMGLGCNPTSPSPDAGTLTIVPNLSVLRVGDQQAFSAVLSANSASSQPVTAIWSSDNESIATVDSRGLAVARLSGNVTISASSRGQTASRPLRIVANVDGNWTGQFVVRMCLSSGVGLPCTGVPGHSGRLVLQVQQLQDQLTGTLDSFGYPHGPVTGTIASDGSFTLTGTLTDAEGNTNTLRDGQGHTDSTSGVMDGRFTVRLEFVGPFGPQFINYFCDFRADRSAK